MIFVDQWINWDLVVILNSSSMILVFEEQIFEINSVLSCLIVQAKLIIELLF